MQGFPALSAPVFAWYPFIPLVAALRVAFCSVFLRPLVLHSLATNVPGGRFFVDRPLHRSGAPLLPLCGLGVLLCVFLCGGFFCACPAVLFLSPGPSLFSNYL